MCYTTIGVEDRHGFLPLKMEDPPTRPSDIARSAEARRIVEYRLIYREHFDRAN